MEIKDKMNMVLAVIDGRAHPSTLRDILPAPGEVEENFIRLAVDFLVAREREKAGGPAPNQFRLAVVKTKEIHEGDEVRHEHEELYVTDWMPERSPLSAPSVQGQLRQQYPNADIFVERKYEH